MGERTRISFCEASINAWWGCTHAHAGCTNCWAATLAKRLGIGWGPQAPRVYIAGWRKTLARVAKRARKVGRRLRVFVNDMSDLFDDYQGPVVDWQGRRLFTWPGGGGAIIHEGSDFHQDHLQPLTLDDLRWQVFRAIDEYADCLTFLLFTKRPQNVQRMWPAVSHDTADLSVLLANHFRAVDARIAAGGHLHDPVQEHLAYVAERERVAVRRHCWLLYSASDQQTLAAGLPHLLVCRDLVPVLGLSLEPLVGPVDVPFVEGCRSCNHPGPYVLDRGTCELCGGTGQEPSVDWVIVGGESGPHRRPCEIEWFEALAQQCADAGVAYYVKQDSSLRDGQQGRIPDELWNRKEFPDDA